jgi:hypothetical protein
MSNDPTRPSTPYENFLYLLAEMEKALERGSIDWPPGAAKAAQRRIARLFVQLDAIIKLPPGH